MNVDRAAGAPLRVGELASATGLTVRTLHHYEEIGLLVPSARSAAGHRLYGDRDVDRLYRIRLLRGLGMGLDAIRVALDDGGWDLGGALQAHARAVARDLAATQRLNARLATLVAALDGASRSATDDLMQLLEEMTMNSPLQQRISILVYADIPAAHAYLVRVFGLAAGEVSLDAEGRCVHAELQAGDGTIWLHPEADAYGLASPRTLGGASATMAVMVDDVDEHHRHAVEQGADVVYPPVDQPYGFREYSARDPEGGLWSFMKPLG
ncbi:MAG TPA: MerR family transcriptional regulator [Microthrixaceae bacterium]|nr:MerR family transcriptional regulator [Microthrixaceae bacterium]HMT62524.1 MerR family transcriptional regulator [Microthrixaceae bacterium]